MDYSDLKVLFGLWLWTPTCVAWNWSSVGKKGETIEEDLGVDWVTAWDNKKKK